MIANYVAPSAIVCVNCPRFSKETVTESNWRGYVQERLAALEWQRVVDDVERFVIDQQGFVRFSKEAIKDLL